ncbi:MAG: HAD family hydrolase [Candidatus Odinarchaeia archaeon]
MKKKILSFDIDGTLATREYPDIIWNEAVPQLYAKKKGLPVQQAKIYLRAEYDKIGDEQVEWYDIQYWFDRFGLENYEELLDKYKSVIRYYPEVKDVLKELSAEYELIIISNAAREFLERTVEEIKHFFKHIFSGPSDFNMIKKSTELYLKICKKLNITTKQLIHIGDNWLQDYLTPRKIGSHAFFIDREKNKQGDFIVHDLIEYKEKLKKIITVHTYRRR